MDRSFLSQPEVVAASRSFVCVRLATYENAKEATVLKSIFIGGSGELENTTFAILDPQAKNLLVRPGRGPNFAFQGRTDVPAREMATTLDQIAAYYMVKDKGPAADAPLPLNGAPRLALNVAACDSLPLVILHAPDAAGRQRLKKLTASIAWKEPLIGRAVYTELDKPGAVKLDRAPGKAPGLTVVAPGAYGQDGKVLAEISDVSDPERVKAALSAALERYVPQPKEIRQHIWAGQQQGVYWQTLLPVTDPGPRGARPR